ncbi:MAG: M20/M25/M40 family metallo-hydrolase [Phenylobacterium sp.]
MGRLLALIAALIAGVVIAWTGERTPSPKPATAPAANFSADRAMTDIAAFASVPHPVGSPANRAARDYLVSRMTALGLQPQVRPGVGVDQPKFAPNVLLGGAIENIVGVLPGKDRGAPAVALMAHYDSVPASAGASDDAAGVASALEIVRAIKARGTPARDVMVVITDGEEAGLLGADAFFSRDPLARRIGFVFNMDVRGSAGRVQMFQTGDHNGGAVRLMGATAPRPVASSLTGFIYKYMPNDTDFTVSRRAGVPGLNYAFIGNQFDYHSPSSVPATQNRGTLQDMGDQVLATAQAVAFAPSLPALSPDLVYSQTPGGITLAYPPSVGWAVLAGALALLVWGVIRARRVEAFPWLDLARGAGGGLFAIVGGIAVLHFARRATGVPFGFLQQRFLLAQAPLWEAAVMLTGLGVLLMAAAELARGRRKAALLPLATGIGCCLFGGLDQTGLGLGVGAAVIGFIAFGRPATRPGAWAGVLLLGLVLAVAAQALAPPAAFVIAWPLAIACLAAAGTGLAVYRGPGSLILLAVVAAIGVAFAATFAHAAYLSLDLAELMAMPLLVAVLPLWPLAQTEEGAPPARLLGPALIIAGLAITVAVRFAHPYDARHPQATYVGYELDQDKHQAWRFSDAPGRTAWSDAVMTGGGGKIGKVNLGPRNRTVDAAPAPYIDLPAPDIAFSKGADGRLTVHIAPPSGVQVVQLRLVANTAATLVGVGGAPVRMPMKPGGDTLIQWAAAQQGFDLTIQPGGPGKLTLTYDATLERWPDNVPPLPKRPANLMPFDLSDSTRLEGSRTWSW